MQNSDSCVKALNHSFITSIGQSDAEKAKFFDLFADERLKAQLSQHYQVKAVIADGVLALETPLGPVTVEFIPATDGNYFCWTAIFSDADEARKHRDLYAVRLGWNSPWTDSTGEVLPMDQWGHGADTLTAFNCIQRVLIAKVRLAEGRFSKLSAKTASEV